MVAVPIRNIFLRSSCILKSCENIPAQNDPTSQRASLAAK